MSKGNSFRDFVLEQLGGVPDVVTRPMFGGHGLYAGGRFFGILYRGVFYLKVDDRSRPAYQAAGMKPFRPFPDRPTTMQYYEVPAGVLDDPEELAAWAAKAIAAASAKRGNGKASSGRRPAAPRRRGQSGSRRPAGRSR